MNLLFVLALELYVQVWLHVWVYTHIYMLLKVSVRKYIFNFEDFFPYLSSKRIAIEGKNNFLNVIFPIVN